MAKERKPRPGLSRFLGLGKGPRVHYLLATPFRYTPARGGSQFRELTDPGVFYGAESVAFPKRRPHPAIQTWWLVVRKDTVIWRRDDACMTFDARQWSGAP